MADSRLWHQLIIELTPGLEASKRLRGSLRENPSQLGNRLGAPIGREDLMLPLGMGH